MEENYDASKLQEVHNQFDHKETEQQGSWRDCSIKVKEESYSIAAKYRFCVISNRVFTEKGMQSMLQWFAKEKIQ